MEPPYTSFISIPPGVIQKILIWYKLCRDRTRWFTGACGITTFELEELLATKVRALYQRRKGRDLFDLWYGLKERKADAGKVVRIFKKYMKEEGRGISARDYEKNIEAKMKHAGFIEDVTPLLPANMNYDIKEAFSLLIQQIVSRIDSE